VVTNLAELCVSGETAVDAARTHEENTDDLALLCHDLKQFVAAGLLLTETPAGVALEPPVARRIGALEELLQQIAAVIDAAAEPQVPSPTLLDLAALVEECVGVVGLNRATRFSLDVPARTPALGVRPLLRRALVNVLDNAARASGAAGSVCVQVRRQSSAAVVTITDSGYGWGRIEHVGGHGLASAEMAMQACRGILETVDAAGEGVTVRVLLPAPGCREAS
jgi:signal transduction histidine kinase